jgi:hypothetical protein
MPFVVAGLFADGMAIIIGTFERWFKYCDESKLNSRRRTMRGKQARVKQRRRAARLSPGFMRAKRCKLSKPDKLAMPIL